MKKTGKILISLLLLTALMVNTTGCGLIKEYETIKNAGLKVETNPLKEIDKAPSNDFTENLADFSLALFKKSINDRDNSLISPLSVMLALSMAANGADNETLQQMERLLGGKLSIDELNEYLGDYAKGLPSDEVAKLGIANSIWLNKSKGDFQAAPDFLQKNTEYFGAEINSATFDNQTLKDINNWISTNTDGMINNALPTIDPDAMIYLINAVVFDAEWQEAYSKYNIKEGFFFDGSDTAQKVDFMYSYEYQRLDDGKAIGFIKPYAGGTYSFVALMPNHDVLLDDYIASLDGEGFLDTLNNARATTFYAGIPKLEFKYEKKMKDVLADLGMSDAFDPYSADFSKMTTPSNGDLYINEVLHKTYLSLDEKGTKAGAATISDAPMSPPGGNSDDVEMIKLDRPFVFSIIDNSTNLPIFMGVVKTV